jgi:hypothetical protein
MIVVAPDPWPSAPGACGVSLVHAIIVTAPEAAEGLWLAVSFHVLSGNRTDGSDASRTSIGEFRSRADSP